MKKMLCIVSLAFGLAVLPGMYTHADAQTKKTTKNAIIGGTTGVVTGALISKDGHRAKGAIIGGVVGTGAGYLWGKHRQKKTGRRYSESYYRKHRRY